MPPTPYYDNAASGCNEKVKRFMISSDEDNDTNMVDNKGNQPDKIYKRVLFDVHVDYEERVAGEEELNIPIDMANEEAIYDDIEDSNVVEVLVRKLYIC